MYPIGQSTVSAKSAEDKLKQSAISEMDEKLSEKTKKYTSNNKERSPIKALEDGFNKDRKKSA